MPINIIKYSFLILCILAISCIEPYDIDRKKFDDLLVIEGMITNSPGPYTINLSKTTFIDNPKKDCSIPVP